MLHVAESEREPRLQPLIAEDSSLYYTDVILVFDPGVHFGVGADYGVGSSVRVQSDANPTA